MSYIHIYFKILLSCLLPTEDVAGRNDGFMLEEETLDVSREPVIVRSCMFITQNIML